MIGKVLNKANKSLIGWLIVIVHVQGQLATTEWTIGLVIQRRDETALAQSVPAIRGDRVVKDEEANLALDLLLDLGADNVENGRQVTIEDGGLDGFLGTL